jgi:hypothetical protein
LCPPYKIDICPIGGGNYIGSQVSQGALFSLCRELSVIFEQLPESFLPHLLKINTLAESELRYKKL